MVKLFYSNLINDMQYKWIEGMENVVKGYCQQVGVDKEGIAADITSNKSIITALLHSTLSSPPPTPQTPKSPLNSNNNIDKYIHYLSNRINNIFPSSNLSSGSSSERLRNGKREELMENNGVGPIGSEFKLFKKRRESNSPER